MSSPGASLDTTSSHGSISTGSDKRCNECDTEFPTKTALYLHSKESDHSPHVCLCGKGFSRLDVLERHVQSSRSPDISFPCPHCKKYRGTRAFRRRDHLTQHLKGYHHVEPSTDSEDSSPSWVSEHSMPPARRKREKSFRCPHEGCDANSGAVGQSGIIFHTQSQLTQHMRESHDESLFPCQEARCPRVGGRGFFRKRDLIKHAKEHHTQQHMT
jgi:hypothetical protein